MGKNEPNFSKVVTEQINQLKQYMNESNNTVIFTGAGMSTEAGLPDFRSHKTGLWENMNPLELASTEAMRHNRPRFIDFYRYRVKSLQACQPHRGHHILANWEREGKIHSIITQNVDGFHHTAGNKNVAELHGTLRTCYCSECGRKFPIERFMEEALTCDCGGFIRPSVVLFGESLPIDTIRQAEMEAEKADLFIVLGSSLSVYPANQIPLKAKKNGAKLVIINMEITDLDKQANLVINGEKIGGILQSFNQ